MRNLLKFSFVLGFAVFLLSACKAYESVPGTQPDSQMTQPVTDESAAGLPSNEAMTEVAEEEVMPQETDASIGNDDEPAAVMTRSDPFQEAVSSGDSEQCFELELLSLQRDCLATFDIEMEVGVAADPEPVPQIESEERSTENQ